VNLRQLRSKLYFVVEVNLGVVIMFLAIGPCWLHVYVVIRQPLLAPADNRAPELPRLARLASKLRISARRWATAQ
jgi:hypothetical protein